MAQDDGPIRVILDAARLPPRWPTHAHPPEFWEQLGRTVATFGFLEEVLKKAVFAYTGTRRYAQEDIERAYAEWAAKMERMFSGNLVQLVDAFDKAARDHPDNTTENIDELKAGIKAAAEIRNVLCHASWRSPDVDGTSVPFFINRRSEVFASPVDVAYLQQVQQHVAELTCAVINSVTHMGIAFPGSNGPGRRIWPGS